MKKIDIRKFNIRELFYKEKFIIFLSIICAFIIWIVISSHETESRPVTVSDIPITITLSDNAIVDGLKVFTGNNVTAEVSVVGNRIVVGQLSNTDIQVVAQQATSITSPGNYTLELTAKKASALTDYQFSSAVTPGFITVMVDRYKEVEFTVEDGIKYQSDPQYFAAKTVLSSPKVKISGPEAEISKVKKIVAQAEVPDVLTKTKNLSVPLVMYDSYGDVISSENISLSVQSEEVTIPILLKKTLPVTPVFTNNPSVLSSSSSRVSLSASNMEIAGTEENFKNMTSANLVPLDFSKVNLSTEEYDQSLDLPVGCKSINDVYSVKIKLDLSDFVGRTKNVTEFSFLNLPEDKQAKVNTSSLSAYIIGFYSEVTNLSSSDLVAEIDMSDKTTFTGSKEVPVKIKVKGKESCWAYGEYKANIEVSQK